MTAVMADRSASNDREVDRRDPADRGILVIEDRAARRVVEGVIERHATNVFDPEVEIASMNSDGIEIAVSFRLEYPTDRLSRVLADVRRRITSEISRQLGRPVRRIDLTVAEFTTSLPAPRRRVI
jgi:uncharacterized alkaline shock family protein YloU